MKITVDAQNTRLTLLLYQTQFYVSACKSYLFEKGMTEKQLRPYSVSKQIEFDDELQETEILPVEKHNIPKPDIPPW